MEWCSHEPLSLRTRAAVATYAHDDMSWDYTAYVKLPNCTRRKLVHAVEKLLGSRPDWDPDDKDALVLPLGLAQVTFHRFGVGLSVSSTEGATPELAEQVEDIAVGLGPNIEESVALELIEQEEADGWDPREREVAEKSGKGRVTIELCDAAGKVLKKAKTTHKRFAQCVGDDFLLHDEAVMPADAPDLLTEAFRLEYPGRTLVCSMPNGKKLEYPLDAYGRVLSVKISES